jgi:hypothetical protein
LHQHSISTAEDKEQMNFHVQQHSRIQASLEGVAAPWMGR